MKVEREGQRDGRGRAEARDRDGGGLLFIVTGSDQILPHPV